MACFDPERREIVLRVVYDGPAMVGKTANLRSLQASFEPRIHGGRWTSPETPDGRTLYFDWLELSAGHMDDWPLRCQVLTVPGQLALAERRYRILRGLDVAVLVCDSTSRGVRAARIALGFLREVLASSGGAGVPLLVQANKQDLADALPPEEIRARLGLGAEAKVIPASVINDDGVRATFLTALDMARRSAREGLHRAGPESFPPPVLGAEQLYDAVSTDGDPDPNIARAIDAAIGIVDVE